MVIKLGGPPDEDVEENNRLIDAFETTAQAIKDSLTTCKDTLKIYIGKSHDTVWLQSNDRTRLDEDIKAQFSTTEAQLAHLRNVFKKYQKKNRKVLSQEELSGRSEQIDLLRKNLNLLKDEF
jgi:hypothetical protein